MITSSLALKDLNQRVFANNERVFDKHLHFKCKMAKVTFIFTPRTINAQT